MMDYDELPKATRADLDRAGAAIVLLRPTGANPATGAAETIETMRVPLTVLREWLNATP